LRAVFDLEFEFINHEACQTHNRVSLMVVPAVRVMHMPVKPGRLRGNHPEQGQHQGEGEQQRELLDKKFV